MPVCTHGRVPIHYAVHGDGPPVLVLAGAGLPGAAWDATTPFLAGHGRVIAPDQRGTGRTPGRGRLTTAALAEDAAAVLAEAGGGPALVYGTSLGGMVAQELALRHPASVRALVLVATAAGGAALVRPAALARLGAFAALGPAGQARALRALAPRAAAVERASGRPLAAQLPSRGGFLRLLAAAATHDALLRLAAVRVPTLVVHGRADRLLPARHASRLAAAVPGARLRLVDDAGHLVELEQPAAVADAVARLVADYAAPASSR